MSNLTHTITLSIVELRRSRLLEIEQSPERFLAAILEQMRMGRLAGTSIPGGQVIISFPDSVVIENRLCAKDPVAKAWERWRKRWMPIGTTPPIRSGSGDIVILLLNHDYALKVEARREELFSYLLGYLRTQRSDDVIITSGCGIVGSFPPSGHHTHRSWQRFKRDHGAPYRGIYVTKE